MLFEKTFTIEGTTEEVYKLYTPALKDLVRQAPITCSFSQYLIAFAIL